MKDKNPFDETSCVTTTGDCTRSTLRNLHASRVGLMASTRMLIGSSQRMNIESDRQIKRSTELVLKAKRDMAPDQ